MEDAISELSAIWAKPGSSFKKAISNFKLRRSRNWLYDALRAQMYEFLDRLITLALPQVRDFRGFWAGFDGRNYNLGIKEQIGHRR